MNGNARRTAATMLTIFVLLLGGLGLLAALPAAAQTKTVQGLVTKESEPFTLLNGVTVTLVDPHGQKAPLVTTTASDGKYIFTPSPGFYYVTVARSGYFDNQTATFRFDGTVNLIRDIEMEQMPAAVSNLTVHVESSEGSALGDASVEIFDLAHAQVLATDLTAPGTGNATYAVWDDTFEVRVEKEGFNTSVTQVAVSGDTSTDVTLYFGIKLVGLARDAEGGFIEEGLVAYLYNLEGTTPEAKRLLTANVTGSSYTFYAYPGNFTVIVDANGTAANVTGPLFVHTGMTPAEKRIDRTLETSPDEEVRTTFHYVAGDWNTLTVWRNLTLNEDSTFPGLPFAFVRDLRLQIDLALGDRDGVLESPEVDALRGWLFDSGPKHVDTQGLFTTNSKAYRSDLLNGTTAFNVTVDVPLAGGVATVTAWTNHSVLGASIPANRDRYFLNLTAGHDTNETVRVNYTYVVEIVAGYERVSEQITGDVVLRHYTQVEVDPQVAAGSFDVRMVVEPSVNGTARPLVIGPAGRFTELNVTAENYTVIVPTEVNVTFSAEESTDPNSLDGRVSPDANFTWTFANTSKAVNLVVWGITPDVNFSELGNYSGDLAIVETGGNLTSQAFTVLVDGLRPVAIIENNVTGLGTNANGTEIQVDEGNSVRFFGGNSTDEVHEALQGAVRDYEWDMDGDGLVDATGKQVDWTFDDPGNVTVNLTVVDRAGHESDSATMWVVVADVDPPDVAFDILTVDFEEAVNIVEGTTYIFDGAETTDNFDVQTNLTFAWDFGDESTAAGVNVTHVFDDFGTLTVTLTVTDQAGNEGNATREIVVEVDAPSRPDLRIEANSLRIDPRSPQESTFLGSVTATIRVNVTNKENRATAEDVTVTFWAFPFGGEEGAPIPVQPTFLDENGNPRATSTLAAGERMTIEFGWQTPSQGNYTVRVNVTDAREPDIFQSPGENSVQTQVDVRQAGWKTPLTIAAIVGIIAGIPVAIFLRRRYGARVRERITRK